MKLGLKHPRHDSRTLRLRDALNLSALPPLKSVVDHSANMSGLQMLGNDQVGDCAVVACANGLQADSSQDGQEWKATEAAVLADYRSISGWNGTPGDPSDTGCDPLDVMKFWQKTGIAGQKIGPYLAVHPQNIRLLCTGVQLFGGMFLGFNLPSAIEGAQEWNLPNRTRRWRQSFDWEPGSWGGHAVWCPAFDLPHQEINILSWAERIPVSFDFISAYAMCAFVVLDPHWTGPDFVCPEGFSVPQLAKMLQQIGQPVSS